MLKNSISSGHKVVSTPKCESLNIYQRMRKAKETELKKRKLNPDSFTPSLKEKLLCASCYYTFGLTGLIAMFVSFTTSKEFNGFTLLHTLQAMFVGIMIALSVFILKAVSMFSSFLIELLSYYNVFYSSIIPHFNVVILAILGIFACICVVGKNFMLPGMKNVAKQILD